MGRTCRCGAVYYGKGRCAAGDACPRQCVGGGQWRETVRRLEDSDELRAEHPGLLLCLRGAHVERQARKAARRVRRAQSHSQGSSV